MISFTSWLSPSVLHALGWILLHFLWQGTAVGALTAVSIPLCRRASARYVLAVGALTVMLAVPVATFLLLISSGAAAPANLSQITVTHPTLVGDVVVSVSARFSGISPSLDALPWLVDVWLFGVTFFSLRSAGGFLLLERDRRKQSITPSAQVLAMCQKLQRRLGLDWTIGYCECKWLQAPAVIGWFRPTILLPATALTGLSEEQLRAVIAHELAHILRLDAFVNLFQMLVETLLFYHPAVRCPSESSAYWGGSPCVPEDACSGLPAVCSA
jgi:beta-lactamase regulating signal transducer with metallopeptidase domain